MDTKSLETLKRIAKGIAGIFGNRCEVVIHDFIDITRSVIHIEGNVTNRQAGAPITSTLGRMVDEFGDEAQMGYCSLCGDLLEEGGCRQCAAVMGVTARLGEGLREPRERLSKIVERMMIVTGRDKETVVRTYIAQGRGEEL